MPGTEGRWFQSALERKAGGAMIGDVAFSPMRGKPQAYVGFTLARPFWGQGYAGESTRRLIDFLFSELNFHRLVADWDADNANSYRLGDEYAYGLPGREWSSNRP